MSFDILQFIVYIQEFRLDKITFSKVKVEHLKKTRNLMGIVTARQRTYLARLLDCPEYEAADKLFSIEIS